MSVLKVGMGARAGTPFVNSCWITPRSNTSRRGSAHRHFPARYCSASEGAGKPADGNVLSLGRAATRHLFSRKILLKWATQIKAIRGLSLPRVHHIYCSLERPRVPGERMPRLCNLWLRHTSFSAGIRTKFNILLKFARLYEFGTCAPRANLKHLERAEQRPRIESGASGVLLARRHSDLAGWRAPGIGCRRRSFAQLLISSHRQHSLRSNVDATAAGTFRSRVPQRKFQADFACGAIEICARRGKPASR